MKYPLFSFRLGKLLVMILLTMLALLTLLVTLTLAIDFPPGGVTAAIQTSGPGTALGIGDWYTQGGQGNGPHRLRIFVPCTAAPGQNFTLELFDPEALAGAVAPDEIRGAADDTTFTLIAPDGTTQVATQTYPPLPATNDLFVNLATFNTNSFGCGAYTLEARTSADDDNGWSMRVTPDDPDGTPGSGDELLIASFQASFQHANPGCQDYFFFVPITPSIRLNNFDLDFPGVDPNATVTYFPPGGGPINGTVSGATVWNNGGGAGHPPPGGDVINNPAAGWWSAQTCTITGNQYIFEPQDLVYFLEQPPFPQMTVSKDDGLTLIAPGQTTTYTLSYANTGNGAALNVTLTDPLPALTTFVGCSGGLSCGETIPGVVTFDLGTVAAGTGGQVTLSIRLDNTFPANSSLTNTVQLNYSDTLGNAYPPVEATDINQTPAVGPDLTINKTDGGITTAPGAVVPYTLAYANVSSTGATGVVITDSVPANTTFNATASAPTIWSCPDSSPAGTVCTTTIGAVAGNSNGSVIFALTLNNPLPPGVTQISNTASIGDDGANGPDPTPGNNVATDDTPTGSVPPPDLTLSKTDNGVTTAPGAVVPYTLNYANVSSTGATGVVITDPVPINATFNATGSAPTVWSCADGSLAGTVCTTTVGSVPGNASGSVTLALKVNDPLPAGVTGISNTASIGDDGANGADPTPGNNATAENTPINLAPTKGDDDDEGGSNDRAPSPPPAGGSAGEFAPVSPPGVEPTPVLPVLLLPETGLREAQTGAGLSGALPWFAAFGLTLASLALWQKAKRRN